MKKGKGEVEKERRGERKVEIFSWIDRVIDAKSLGCHKFHSKSFTHMRSKYYLCKIRVCEHALL